MNLSEEDLRTLVEGGEGRELEFKRGLPRDERLARTLCAFANTRGGWLLVGVNDNRSVYGCPRPKEVMADIRRVAAQFLLPAVRVETTVVRCEPRAVVAARVNASMERPHCVLHGKRDKEIVVRVGSSNRVAEGSTLSALRTHGGSRRALDPLEAKILDWVERRSKQSTDPGGDATPTLFGKTFNIGVQRARKAFVRLERDGRLVAHGTGTRKIYSCA